MEDDVERAYDEQRWIEQCTPDAAHCTRIDDEHLDAAHDTDPRVVAEEVASAYGMSVRRFTWHKRWLLVQRYVWFAPDHLHRRIEGSACSLWCPWHRYHR